MHKSETHQVWFAQDLEFKKPKVHVKAVMTTPDLDNGGTPEDRVFIDLWEKLTDEAMRESNYASEMANLNFWESFEED